MATRKQIREAFKSALENAVPSSGNPGHVPADDIKQESPESEEDLPTIVYDDAYRDLELNGASSAPARVETTGGTVDAEVYQEVVEGQFSTLLLFTDEADKEACYEAVRSYFGKFKQTPWDPSSVQSDIAWIRVPNVSSDDDNDIDPARRGDRLLINIVFTRDYRDDDDSNIAQVNTDLDADDDGSTDLTWTSN